jgi:hypothetical protein
MFIEVTPESLRENPSALIGSDWMLITTGTAELLVRNIRRARIDTFPWNNSRCLFLCMRGNNTKQTRSW